MQPPSAPEVPFTAPWEGRAFAMAVALVRDRGVPWESFRSRLVAAIDEAPERPYYEAWLVALVRYSMLLTSLPLSFFSISFWSA